VNGIVISRNVDVGQTVAPPSRPDPVLDCEDLTKMQVDTNVDESDIGRAVLARRDVHGGRVAGKDVHGGGSPGPQLPIVTQNVVTYNVVVRVDNREMFLKPG